jgi:hypothetical protein
MKKGSPSKNRSSEKTEAPKLQKPCCVQIVLQHLSVICWKFCTRGLGTHAVDHPFLTDKWSVYLMRLNIVELVIYIIVSWNGQPMSMLTLVELIIYSIQYEMLAFKYSNHA